MTVHYAHSCMKKLLFICHFLPSLQMQQQDSLDSKCRMWVCDNQA